MQHNVDTYRPKPDGSVDPAGEAGWFMQRERERLRIAIDDVARDIGIHARHIEAIEVGDLTELPPRADTLRMVGVYSEYLGLDPQPLVLHYAQFLPRGGPSRKRRARRPLSSATIIEFPLARRLASFASGSGGIVASCLGAVLLFGVASWALSPQSEMTAMSQSDQMAALVQEEEAPQAAESEPAEETDAPDAAEAEQQSGDIAVASVTTIREEPLGDDVPETTASIEPDSESAGTELDGLTALIEQEVGPSPRAAAEGDREYGKENADSRLVLRAKSPVWIRIEDGKGNVIVTQTLMTGDRYRVPNREGLVIIARDGGLLTYEVDGVSKGNLGSPGEILVGRSLDLARLASKG